MNINNYLAKVSLPPGPNGMVAILPIPLDKEIYDNLVQYHDAKPPEKGSYSIHMDMEEYERIEDIVQQYIDASKNPDSDVRNMLQALPPIERAVLYGTHSDKKEET